MFKKNQIRSFIIYSIVAAIIYLFFVVIFLKDDSYTKTYILYIGNMIFALVMVVFIVNFNNKRDNNSHTQMVIASGMQTALIGTIISCLVLFIILAIMKPVGYAYVANTARELAKPAPALEGNGHALMLVLFMDAIFGNMGASAFVCFMLPNMLRKYKSNEPTVVNPE
ncbi:MAG: hypothetical protein ABI267_01150 [Ginsengibacter sp.]